MHLRSIEPTPNPNNMKLNLEESLPPGVRHTYSAGAPELEQRRYPDVIRRLLAVPGVKSLYHCLDFLALQRVPSAEWEALLGRVRAELASGEGGSLDENPAGNQGLDPAQNQGDQRHEGEGVSLGRIAVFIQFYRRIPLLVKVQAGGEERRVNLPPRFAAAVKAATPASPNMLLERRWVPSEPRYGELGESGELVATGEAVAAEIDAAYPDTRLETLVRQAFELGAEAQEARRVLSPAERRAGLASAVWKERYAALESIGADAAWLPELTTAMRDSHVSVRRLATIYTGLLKTAAILEPLCAALKDPAAVVRRTAGDALNDLANPAAAPAMAEALRDSNKLVRWRAARFLYELGGAEALPALRGAADDSEFEVRLQVAQAVERIAGGREAAGPVWMRMTEGGGK